MNEQTGSDERKEIFAKSIGVRAIKADLNINFTDLSTKSAAFASIISDEESISFVFSIEKDGDLEFAMKRDDAAALLEALRASLE